MSLFLEIIMNPTRVWLSMAFVVLSRIGVTVIEADDQCNSGEPGMFLLGHTFKTVKVELPHECSRICDEDDRCQSYNVLFGANICELNSNTKEEKPEDFLPDVNRFYRQQASKRAFWQKINTVPVCFGARNDTYGKFILTKTGFLKTIKLVHKSGSIRCNDINPDSFWGCLSIHHSVDKLSTLITNANRDVLLPPTGELEGMNTAHPEECQKKHFYSFAGTGRKSPELVFRNLASPLSLSKGEELQIWNGEDWSNCYEENNNGSTCVDVYALYLY
ncbi:uncharacterized protein [Montipora foliosa]|uniref:uncharacterized protein isoform X2 n=1 Tax=Montipora foliosa TaxID=591990 RepID=UPI0035F14B17